VKLDIRAFSIAGAIFWGGMNFLLGVANLFWPPYGGTWLEVVASVYPGYQVTATFGAVIVLTLYAAIDGAIAGAVLAWLYNRFARSSGATP